MEFRETPHPFERIPFIDTHTGGEPTRVVLSAPLEFSSTDPVECRDEFRDKFDHLRRAIACEPRGHDVLVGALLLPPHHLGSIAGAVFFNNVGYLGMCGHGTLGVAAALQFLGRIGSGVHRLDTPAGTVEFTTGESGWIKLTNVASYRFRRQVPLRCHGVTLHGDIAWGGNWFFICQDHGLPIDREHLPELERFTRQLRVELEQQGIRGEGGAVVDHMELIGPASDRDLADARNFVLCPGGVYDRSPCGTGTSAKVACLAAEGLLQPGQVFRQQSIVGSIFHAAYQPLDAGRVLPSLSGTAHVIAQGELLLDPNDPYCTGF